MTARIIPISPHITLGRIHEQLDRLFGYGRYRNDETVMQYAESLKQLHRQLSEEVQQRETVKMLEDSIAFRRQR